MATTENITLDPSAFLAGLHEVMDEFRLTAKELTIEVGGGVVEVAQALAPAGATGDLRGSLGMDEGEDATGPYVDVGTSLYYGIFQEYGTSKMAAHPFMRPALAVAGRALRLGGIGVSRTKNLKNKARKASRKASRAARKAARFRVHK